LDGTASGDPPGYGLLPAHRAHRAAFPDGAVPGPSFQSIRDDPGASSGPRDASDYPGGHPGRDSGFHRPGGPPPATDKPARSECPGLFFEWEFRNQLPSKPARSGTPIPAERGRWGKVSDAGMSLTCARSGVPDGW
jgi:hypothetical protein